MKQYLALLSLLLLVLFGNATAQTRKTTARVEKQHKATAFMKEHLKQTEDETLKNLQSPFENQGLNGPLQTVRELEQFFPDYPFEKLLLPLENILKDEQAEPSSRMLAALALDELHSDAGDLVVKAVADKCDNSGVQSLCKALLGRGKTD